MAAAAVVVMVVIVVVSNDVDDSKVEYQIKLLSLAVSLLENCANVI